MSLSLSLSLPKPVERHGQHDDRARDDLLHPVRQASLRAANLDDGHGGGTEDGPGHGAAAAGEAAAADDDGGGRQ